MSEAGFKLIHHLPRRWYRASRLFGRAAKSRYLYDQSRARFDKRDDAFTSESEVLTGKIGYYEGFSIFVSELPPAPPGRRKPYWREFEKRRRV